ncbi:MAG: flagellar basal body-associated FliL family protein [Paracoccaceae bacterium]|nr:flagellar basal body-associated FliL family protein [Paracoccaceae bacterium]
MADASAIEPTDEPKSSKMPLIVGIVLLLLGAGAGFYTTWSGMILSSESVDVADVEEERDPQAITTFIPLEPITVSLPQHSQQKHLRFRAQLEVSPEHAAEVEQNIPRVVDVLNTYLRAIEVRDIQDPSSLARLRAQMLRRVQVATGRNHVNDLLIMEFVLN